MSLTVTSPTASSVAPAAAPASLTDQPAASCLNCGQPVAQRFCGYCGQDAHHTPRFTLRYLLLHDLAHSVWHVDKGVLYTLKQLLTRPGAAIREYMAGQRARHFRPIAYLLLLGGLSALLMNLLELHPKPQAADPNMPRALSLTLERYMDLVFKYPGLLYGILTPPNALLAWWLLRPSRLNYAEMLLAQAYISGTQAFLTTVAMLPLLPFFGDPQHYNLVSAVSMLPTLGYATWVNEQLLRDSSVGAAARWLRAAATSALQLGLLLLISVVLLIAIMVSLLRQDPALKQDFKTKVKAQAAAAQTAPRR